MEPYAKLARFCPIVTEAYRNILGNTGEFFNNSATAEQFTTHLTWKANLLDFEKCLFCKKQK